MYKHLLRKRSYPCVQEHIFHAIAQGVFAEMLGTTEKTGFPTKIPGIPQDAAAYRAWREEKLSSGLKAARDPDPVEIRDLANPGPAEREELARRCARFNAAFYVCPAQPEDPQQLRRQLRGFVAAMGLNIAERHRSAGDDGIVALTPSERPAQRGYIPYTRRPLNWHTDGYYNPPEETVRAMVLHCFRPASDGGVNQFLDQEIAYIRLRDENPAYVEALMHPEAMTIPENREDDGSLRPASIGPVFMADPHSGALQMRYTARTRSIAWRDDPTTREAVDFLARLLASDDPLILTRRMEAGEGVLCNNVLHNRTGFSPDTGSADDRLLFRIRFHNRVPAPAQHGPGQGDH